MLSTCNRVEIYHTGVSNDAVIQCLAQVAETEHDALIPHLYLKSGVCVACHLFRVASGLDSAVLGETEIVAQVKSAWRDARNCGATLNLLFRRALEASKEVRTKTSLCHNVTSLASLAVRHADQVSEPLVNRSVLILGAGQIAERVAKELSHIGAKKVTILNRTLENAQSLASRFGFASGGLNDLDSVLVETDVVFAAATTISPLITQANFPEGRNLALIDLGIPHNIDVSGANVLNVDSLLSECARNNASRNAAIPDALSILEVQLEGLAVALEERQAAATIKGLVQLGESVQRRSLDWALERLLDLTDKERRVVEDLARRIAQGILSPPIEELKKGGFSSNDMAVVERAFRISPNEASH